MYNQLVEEQIRGRYCKVLQGQSGKMQTKSQRNARCVWALESRTSEDAAWNTYCQIVQTESGNVGLPSPDMRKSIASQKDG